MTRPQAVGMFKIISYIGIYGGLLMPAVFIPTVIFPFVFSKLIAFQILIGLTFPAYLAIAWMEPRFRPPKALLYNAIIAYFVALALSTIFSVDASRSWWGNQERMNGLFTLLHFFAWLTMAVGMLKTWTDWKKLLNYEVVVSVFMATVSLLQIPFPRLLLFQAGPRVGGLLDNPIYMGSYQLFNLFFLGLLFLKTKSKTARAWYIVAALIDIGAFLATQSRGALVGLAAALGCFALYYAIFTQSKKAKWGILGAVGGMFASYGVVYLLRDTAFVMQNSILNRLTHFNMASETRFIAWEIAWKGFLERPLTGWGFDAYYILFNVKYNPRSLEFGYYETWFDRAHNTVFDVLAMTGLFGLLTFFAIFTCLFISVWRAQKKGWIDLPIAAVLVALPVGYFLQNLFVFDHPAAFSMSYLLFALVIAATRAEFIGKKEETSMPLAAPASAAPAVVPQAAPWTLFTILQILCLIVVWRYSVLPFQASALSIRANQLRSVNLEASWALMKQAGATPTPYLDEQTFLLSRDLIGMASMGQLTEGGQWREMYQHAKQITEKYILDHPRNTNAHFIYARMVHEVAGYLPLEEQPAEIALAEREYKAAIDTSPKRQQLHYALARLYSMTGHKQEAYDVLKQTIEFNQNIGESWWYLGLTDWMDFGKVDQGMDSILKAVTVKQPYALKQARDAMWVAQAAAARGNKEVLLALLIQLPTLPGGSEAIYLDIARAYEYAGLIQERNIVLNALQQAVPAIAPQFELLRTGAATSIDASIANAPEPIVTPEPVTSTSTTSSTAAEPPAESVATSVPATGGGIVPRR